MNTTFIPWGNLVFYTFMNAFGHWYVNTSNLNFVRKSFVLGEKSSTKDFALCICMAPFFWLFSTIMVMRS